MLTPLEVVSRKELIIDLDLAYRGFTQDLLKHIQVDSAVLAQHANIRLVNDVRNAITQFIHSFMDVVVKEITDPITGLKMKKKITVYRSYPILSQKVNYYFKKWIEPVDPELTPYIFRHNRFTIVADTKGFDYKDILKMKGGRSLANVEKYIHVSKERREKWKKVLLK